MVSGSHAYARRARVSNRSFVFLLSQVSHMRKKERKREEEFCKTEGWNTRFSMSFHSFMSAQSACLLKLFKMSA